MRVLSFGLLVAAFAALGSSQTTAQDANSFGQLADKSWGAFGCSALAMRFGDDDEGWRLFSLGYQSGVAFYSALANGKLDNVVVDSVVPEGFVSTITGGPSADFAIGINFERATARTLASVHGAGNEVMAAQQLFRERNCSLLN